MHLESRKFSQPCSIHKSKSKNDVDGSRTNIKLADTASGVTICYTTNGTAPGLGTTNGTCANGSTPYVSGTTIPVSVGTTIMIKAVAGLNGYGASKVVSATYTII